jgi:hypothetical protein
MESAVLAIIGSIVGGLLGIAYAGLMLYGLQTWWVDAIGTQFLQLEIGRVSLIVGIIIGILASLGTITWTVLGLRKVAIGRLLSGEVSTPFEGNRRRVFRFLPPTLLVLAVVLAIAATFLGGEAQAGAFFGSGASVLLATLMITAQLLRHRGELSDGDGLHWDLRRFVVRNVARNPGGSSYATWREIRDAAR